MELDPNLLNKIKSLDDESLKEMIKNIATAAGINEKLAEKAASDPSKLRKKVSSMSEKDMKKLMDSVKPEQAEEILKHLKM